MAIKKAAVIGAGVMGAGIAAQLANAGIEVELLDRVAPTGDDRTAIARGAIEKMLKTNPAPLMHKKNARRIRPGNTDDDIGRLKECDIIIEAVFEDPKVKFDIFQKIDANRKAGSIVASNTSTIPLKDLMNGQSEQFKKDFVITHFFNPPRYMRLLELITSEHNSPEMVGEVTRFMDETVGKGVVVCNDTPGFIANRIGTYWIQTAINEAVAAGLDIEDADAVLGKPQGIPPSGVFGLVDMVGLDLMPYIGKSLRSKLPADDAYVADSKTHPVIDKMIADGFIGRKTPKGGFYRRDANKNDFAVDLKTGDMRPKKDKKSINIAAVNNAKKAAEKDENSLQALFDTRDAHGTYAWTVFKKSVSYAAEHVHDISSGIYDLDRAMKFGYNWEKGPFEMLDNLGVDYFIRRMKAEGEKVPAFIEQAAGKTFYREEAGQLQYMKKDGAYTEAVHPEGVILLEDIKRKSKPVATASQSITKVMRGTINVTNAFKWIGAKVKGKKFRPLKKPEKMGATLWDIGDGVLCLEFSSDQNSLDFGTMKMIHKACDLIEKEGSFKSLVIYNEGKNFSPGANLYLAAIAARAKQNWVIEKMVKSGQEALKRLKYANFPVVAAPFGFVFGGGCEIVLHSNNVQAHAETYMGLVEAGVGLLPAWGGTTEMLTRAKQNKHIPNGPMPAAAVVFETISTAKVSPSAQEAKDLMYLRATDSITMNKERLLGDAKKKAIDMLGKITPEKPFDMQLPGPAGAAAFDMAVDGFYLKGMATPYDVVVGNQIGRVISGGEKADVGVTVTQDYIRDLERKYFMELVHDPRTIARIEYTLANNKPLREKPEPKKAAELRSEAPSKRQGFFARVFKGDSAKKSFDDASQKTSNDNNEPKRDPKAKINWPKPGK